MRASIFTRWRPRIATALVAIVTLSGSLLGLAAPAAATATVVRPGESIQAALDAARPGDTIQVKAGTYREFLVIDKDRIRLIGHNVVLRPAEDPASNACSFPGSSPLAGVCIFANRVTLRGFSLRGFPTWGAYVTGHGTRIEHNELAGSFVGLVVQGSSSTTVRHNRAHDNESAGILFVESDDASATVAHNELYRNGVGLAILESSHGVVRSNNVSGNCAGIVLINGEDSESRPVSDWRFAVNAVHANNRRCPGDPDAGSPPFSGLGIAVIGADHVVLRRNTVQHNVPAGPSAVSGGVVVASSADTGGSDPHHVTVTRNLVTDNAPDDLLWDGSGTAVRFDRNRCDASSPAGLC